MDSQYQDLKYISSEMPHHYGGHAHILSNPALLTQLAKLCAPETKQPVINELTETIYRALLQIVVNVEFPKITEKRQTRMRSSHPMRGYFEGPVIDSEVPVVCVNLARAGTVPSHICYSALNYFMNPERVRQDHIGIARQTNASAQVTGSDISGHKIGGRIDGALVLFPDPMGATGGTLVEAMEAFQQYGTPRKFIAIHCIITPGYLKKTLPYRDVLSIYALRLDRGLSSEAVLESPLGSLWDQEKGLDDRQYIVPGGGGFGEILNNSYV